MFSVVCVCQSVCSGGCSYVTITIMHWTSPYRVPPAPHPCYWYLVAKTCEWWIFAHNNIKITSQCLSASCLSLFTVRQPYVKDHVKTTFCFSKWLITRYFVLPSLGVRPKFRSTDCRVIIFKVRGLLAELFLLFDWKYFGVEISRRTTCRRRADDLRMTCRWPADDTRVRLQARFGWRMTYVIRNVIRTLAWVAQFYAVLHLVSSTVKGTRLISQKVK